jgi:hypothetical protein
MTNYVALIIECVPGYAVDLSQFLSPPGRLVSMIDSGSSRWILFSIVFACW